MTKAVTRGNGVTGEVVTNNARVFKNVPLKIPYQGRLVLRGEAIITYSDFERINESIEDVDAKYKNPRNLCSGSVRQLNNEITARRNVRFYAFTLVSADGVDFHNSRARQFEWLKEQGFDVVEYRKVTASTLDEAMEYFQLRSLRMIFRQTDWLLFMMILHTEIPLEEQRNFPEMLLHSNGQMRSEKPIFLRSNGARQEQG